MIEYKTFSHGLLGSNTYLAWDADSLEAMVVDCGNDPRTVRAFALEKGLSVRYIVLTHGHYDHAEYVEEFAEAFPDAKTVSHKDEAALLSDPSANLSVYFGSPKSYPVSDIRVVEGDKLSLGSIDFAVLSTPGHTQGCICLYSAECKLIFTGDTLFMCGRGRTDFPYGDELVLWRSLNRLLSLDGDVLFLSGHGAPSKIGNEVGRIF